MTINIQYVKMPTSETLTAYTTAKLEKLGNHYPWLINADVYFKIEPNPNGIDKTCEMELSAPGPRIFASSLEENFELAVKHTISDLKKQLKKRKAQFLQH